MRSALERRRIIGMSPTRIRSGTPAGAIRAARALFNDDAGRRNAAELIDRETGLSDLIDTLEAIVSEAGDLVETRSPELVARAQALISRNGDPSPRED